MPCVWSLVVSRRNVIGMAYETDEEFNERFNKEYLRFHKQYGRTTNLNNMSDKKQGFANMNPDLQKEIARKGGLALSRNREHMAAIGRKGGEASQTKRKNKIHDHLTGGQG